ncbi:esterase [Flavobacteriaceae bacterium TK19130]|nr:esterase [Thermobacterium salinum]
MADEHRVSYSATNTYNTLYSLTPKTKNIWLVFHGMGYLSRYFIRYFKELNAEENYIIAPQAPSKYYQTDEFKHVGASWLTRENTKAETENILRYIDAVWNAEKPTQKFRFIVMGYSQGVSIATRWLASRKLQCDVLLLHSGAIPKELLPEDFSFQKESSDVLYHYGLEDEYITEARKTAEKLKGSALFGNRLMVSTFKGKHEVDTKFLQDIAKNL